METIIKWSNRCALLSILLLIYWVFTFISIQVFDLKVLGKNLTEIFFLSVLGILALMSGSLVVNIMFNLTKIANSITKHYGLPEDTPKAAKKLTLLLLSLFPILFCFLYTADLASTIKREKLILNSAEHLVADNNGMIQKFSRYEFSKQYINYTSNALRLLEGIDEHFPDVDLIVEDKIKGKTVYLNFTSHHHLDDDDTPRKTSYIFSSSKEERQYLQDIFSGNNNAYRFSANDGFYELYYPVEIDGKIVLIYLTDRKKYGKIGS